MACAFTCERAIARVLIVAVYMYLRTEARVGLRCSAIPNSTSSSTFRLYTGLPITPDYFFKHFYTLLISDEAQR